MKRRVAVLVAGAVLLATSARGQESLLPSTGWGLGMGVTVWHLTTALPQSSGAVADVVEFAIPFRVRTVAGRWSFDLSGAGAYGAVHLTANNAATAGQNTGNGDGGDRLVSIAGPTDIKLRGTGPVLGDNTLITVGLNLPSGKVGLNGDETAALQAIGAPAMHMPVGAFGTGAGATIGLIRVIPGENWALALGASAEQRSEYSPIALILAAGKSETKVTPGTAAHVTVGYDRPLGEGRWSLLFAGDVFSKDVISASGGGEAAARSEYTLGPQFTLASHMQFAAHGWREAAFTTSVRRRSEFSDSAGAKVAGSSGTYLEASVGGVRGGSSGTGFIVGADARWHSGMTFTDALVGAATTAAGVTLGIERAGVRTLTRWTLHGQYGTFDTGRASTTGMGVTIGVSIAARREAQ